MTKFGINLASEAHGPKDLAEYAAHAEGAGLDFAVISDHYHPWTSKQGQSPFVWSTLGTIASETEELELGTAVTCPTFRIHPAIVAQAAATVGVLLEDRFFLGVGTGERLNEHILGDPWPPHRIRLEKLEEAVEIIRELWSGEMVTHRGEHYTVDNAQVFTRPDDPPPILVSGLGPHAAEAAGRIGDGFIATSPESDLIERYEDAAERSSASPASKEQDGGDGPKYGGARICWAESDEEAKKMAYEWWPNTGLQGVGSDLPTPAHFDDAVKNVEEEDVAETVVTGPDPDPYIDRIQEYLDAGFDNIYLHQTGENQTEAYDFLTEEVLPSFL